MDQLVVSLAEKNTLAYLIELSLTKKKNMAWEKGALSHIHNTSFSSSLTIQLNKLECLLIASLFCLVSCNTLA